MIDQSAARRATQEVPSIPRDTDGPVFREPWEAQAFAMTLALHKRGLFTWKELAGGAREHRRRKGRDNLGDTASLSRCLGPRLRPHPAWPADRAACRGFRLGAIGGNRRHREERLRGSNPGFGCSGLLRFARDDG
jgi:hypothetical protein